MYFILKDYWYSLVLLIFCCFIKCIFRIYIKKVMGIFCYVMMIGGFWGMYKN